MSSTSTEVWIIILMIFIKLTDRQFNTKVNPLNNHYDTINQSTTAQMIINNKNNWIEYSQVLTAFDSEPTKSITSMQSSIYSSIPPLVTNAHISQIVLTDFINSLIFTNTNVITNCSQRLLSVIKKSNTIQSMLEIDELIKQWHENIIINTSTLFLMSQARDESTDIMGVSFLFGNGGHVITNENLNSLDQRDISVAAIINAESLAGVSRLNVLVINTSLNHLTVNDSSGKSFASPIIMVNTHWTNKSLSEKMNVSLYYKISEEYKPNVNATYFCSFYDPTKSTWSESGCTDVYFNRAFDRYECSCNHLTSFALLWLPKDLTDGSGSALFLNAQDIVSIVFQSISIICLLFIIVHRNLLKYRNPLMRKSAEVYMSEISMGTTILFFIFYIALCLTVFTRTQNSSQTECFTSASVLMFIVYFLLIFMLCIKVGLGYFNYRRWVKYFPIPTFRSLATVLIISFVVSIILVSFAAGFNSNPSFGISQLYPNKICWFSQRVIYYFLTIQTCILLALNLLSIILIIIRLIYYINFYVVPITADTRDRDQPEWSKQENFDGRVEEPPNQYESDNAYLVKAITFPHKKRVQQKRGALTVLLLFSTQGIGWVFAPFIHIPDSTTSTVFSWLFIIFGALEGFWILLLYIVLLRERSYERDVRRDEYHIEHNDVRNEIEITNSNEHQTSHAINAISTTQNYGSSTHEVISSVF